MRRDINLPLNMPTLLGTWVEQKLAIETRTNKLIEYLKQYFNSCF